jgi:ankyrin repeat protein
LEIKGRTIFGQSILTNPSNLLQKALRKTEHSNFILTVLSAQREEHIRAKYVERQFVDGPRLRASIPEEKENEVLEKAVMEGNIELLVSALALGIKLRNILIGGKTLLHIASQRTDLGMIDFLCSNGVKILDKDNDGKTALDAANSSGLTEVFQALQKRSSTD